MERLTERRKIQRAIMLFAFAYLVSYITRINFALSSPRWCDKPE